MDINNAFLNRELTEDIYMRQPSGFEVCESDGVPLACRVNKALYGLK